MWREGGALWPATINYFECPPLCALSVLSRSGLARAGLWISDAQLFFKVTLKLVMVEPIRYSDGCSGNLILVWFGMVSLLNGPSCQGVGFRG